VLNLSISRANLRPYCGARVARPVETVRESGSEAKNKNTQEVCHDAIHDDS
jgi:hypothetical protein